MITTTATQPPATIAAIRAFVPAIIALIGVLFIKIDLANYVTSLIITLLFSTTCAILIRLLNKKGMDVFKNIG